MSARDDLARIIASSKAADVERVAKALWLADEWRDRPEMDGDEWWEAERYQIPGRRRYETLARAAIAALKGEK